MRNDRTQPLEENLTEEDSHLSGCVEEIYLETLVIVFHRAFLLSDKNYYTAF